ncbi:MAG: Card1-like endonuclease domain-containing protein [Gammaproteobacteria bacterium]
MQIQQIHLLVVTGQPQANLIPIMQFKPDIVVLAVSNAMQNNAKSFKRLLTDLAGYQEQNILQFDDVPDVGLAAIKDRALEIEDELQQRYPNSPITYHATGGTKLMALGFYEVFKNPLNTVLYTDTEHGRIEVVYPEDRSAIAIEKVLTIESYLFSMGKQHRNHGNPEWQNEVRLRRDISIWLAREAGDLHTYWSVINKLAHDALAPQARGKAPALAAPEQYFDKKNKPFRKWQEALKKLTEAGICQWNDQEPERLCFTDPSGAQYLSGGWLEEYVWLTASGLGCDQVWANVDFTEAGNPKNDVRNEMDCLVLHNNRLLMIECKTSVFKAGNAKNDNILYKLDTLERRAGGLFGDAWLVSARELDEHTRNRAREYNIKIISGGELSQFQERIQAWMRGKV